MNGFFENILSNMISSDIYGYQRHACITNDTLKILNQFKFHYDSSYIKFENHNLYNNLNIKGLINDNSKQYYSQEKNLYEFEIPTTKILNYNLPISGGGYFIISC